TSQLNALGILDNDMSSLKVQSGYEITLYPNDSFSGTPLILNSNTNCLVAYDLNDAVSSVKVSAITKTTPTITWNNPNPLQSGTPLSATQLNATASTTGSFSYSPTSGTTLSSGTHTLS